MAIWAAVISAGVGAASSKKSRDAIKEGNRNAAGNISDASQSAIEGLQPYGEVGKQAFYQLAGLAGIQGYRTPQEVAYTEHSRAKPTLGGGTAEYDKSGTEKLLGKSVSANKLAGTKLEKLGGYGAVQLGKSRRKSAALQSAEQERINQEAEAKYQTDLSTWDAKGKELQLASDESIKTYNPTAALESRPGYQFRINQGQKATNAMSSAQGNVLSGEGIKRLQENAQGIASQEYGNEFNRLLQLSGIGQNATTTQGNIGMGAGTNLANLNVQGGQNQANYYSNLNDITQGTASNLSYLNNRNSRTSSYDINSPTDNKKYKPGQTLDASLYN